ncbi:nuclear transport factor 2 family protein [Kitasatospora sp. NBC_00315]|uniref:nuclear transport factor 2 family protein n=1 Tax=Kitasatospora sp. NBC_00315 TaxID=2975963 RepID=UPI003248EB7A
MQTANSGTLADPVLYEEIQAFYARHMQLIDEGSLTAWAATFTEDAVISNNVNPRPAEGRPAIAAVIHRAHGELASKGIQQRHWMGMLTVEPVDGENVRARSYALILNTAAGGAPAVERSTVCHDELSLVGGAWQIRRRRVHHDG